MKKADDFIPHMERAYRDAISSMQKDINDFFQRFADNEGMTMTQARKLYTAREMKDFRMTLEEYIAKGQESGVSDKWLKELESASDLHRIDRLKALQLQLANEIESLSAYKEQELNKTLSDIYEEGYYRNIFDIQQINGVGSAFARIDKRKINQALSKPWTYDGKTFSDRIWQDKEKLKHSIEKTLTQSIIRGEAPLKTAKRIAQETNVELSSAKRLVLTESAAMSNKASMDSYKELGVDEIEFVSALDGRTCDICGAMDGKHFKTSEGVEGINLPPLHPNCRCTTVPYFNDEFTQDEMRAARDENGKTYYVPSDMTFEEWKSEYVEKTDSADRYNAKSIISGILGSATGSTEKIMKDFHSGLKDMKNEGAKNILEKISEITPVHSSFKKNSYHRNGEIYLKSNTEPSTVAHELFHAVDKKFGISESGYLTESIKNDYKRLQNIADGYGSSIEDMLYSKYPEAFIKNYGRLELKEEYRGISDILSGMSGGKIKLGYSHPNDYWEKPFKVDKETWAQFGRILYRNDEDAIQILKYICNGTYPEIMEYLEVINNVPW